VGERARAGDGEYEMAGVREMAKHSVILLPLANNESSEVIDILLPVSFILTLRPGLIMSKTSDDSLLASRCAHKSIFHSQLRYRSR